MMKLPGSLTTIAALSAGAVQMAVAATNFLPTTVYCNSGQALKTCAAFQITTSATATGGTLVQLLVQNLAGQYSQDNTGGSFLTKSGLGNTVGNYVTGALLVSPARGAVNVVGSPDARWGVGSGSPELGTLEFFDRTGDPAKAGAIQGCPVVSNPTEYLQTCSPPYPGFVSFQLETDLRWFASDALIAYKLQGASAAGLSLECISNPQDLKFNCTPARPPHTVIPEPAIMILMATALVGLACAGFLHRRKIENA